MICNKGINDMPYGWRLENKLNEKIYKKWKSMIERCYSEKHLNEFPTYKGCYVCDRWLKLSNFVDDFKLIDGYNEEDFLNGKLCLDKDIKSNGVNKCYCLENCMLVSDKENSRQAVKTRNNEYLYNNNYLPIHKQENHPMAKKVAQYDLNGNLIKIWDYIKQAVNELHINNGSIVTCCKFWEMNCNKEEWYKSHKNNPIKQAGGFIWKYYKGEDTL